MIEVHLRLFGRFREFGDGETCSIRLPTGSKAADARRALAELLRATHPDRDVDRLIHDAVLADDEDILSGETVLDRDMTLAILPPVCGG